MQRIEICYTAMVSALTVKAVVKRCNGREAGPFTTAPVVLYCDPWHGHVNI